MAARNIDTSIRLSPNSNAEADEDTDRTDDRAVLLDAMAPVGQCIPLKKSDP